MSVYTDCDWDAGFAAMAPSPAEVEAERLYWQELDRQEHYADHLAAKAEQGADESDGEPEVEPAPAPRKRERIAAYDGLTKSERQALYVPEAYRVERTGPIQFRALNVPTGAEFTVSVIFGRFARVTSNTGREYLLHNGACCCAHKQNGATACKHESATAAVMAVYRQDPIFAELDAEIARRKAEREQQSPALKAA